MDGAAARGDAGRYVQRAFNLAYRISGSEAVAADAVEESFREVLPRLADGELAFRLQLLTATRNACHEGTRARQSEKTPQPALPLGADTAAASQQEEIRDASMRLPERQREALALRELEELSYDEIATIMKVSPHAVAELISRARINLCGELGGTALASAAAPSPECERALPLIARRDDRQLDVASREASWLDAHLAGCGRCMLAVEAMREAHASYRAWETIAAPSWLLEEALAKAAGPTGPDSTDAMPRRRRARRRTALAAGLAAFLLLVGLAAALVGNNPQATPPDSAAGAPLRPHAGATKGGKKKRHIQKKKKKKKAKALVTAAAISNPPPTSIGGGASGEPVSGQSHPSQETAIQPTLQTSAPKSGRKPKAAPTPAPAPTSQPAAETAAEEPAPAAEPTTEPAHGHEPPGRPPDRPPR